MGSFKPSKASSTRAKPSPKIPSATHFLSMTLTFDISRAVEPKAAILEEGKSVMKLMVGLIQYNDMYDVMVGLKQVKPLLLDILC